jgi:hypothetical protein
MFARAVAYQGGGKPRPYPTTNRYACEASQIVQGRGGACPCPGKLAHVKKYRNALIQDIWPIWTICMQTQA